MLCLSSGHLPLKKWSTTTIRDGVHWPCTCSCGNSLVHMKGLKTRPGQPILVVYTTTNVCIHLLVWGSNWNVHLLLCSKIAHQFCCVEVSYQLQMTIVRMLNSQRTFAVWRYVISCRWVKTIGRWTRKGTKIQGSLPMFTNFSSLFTHSSS